MAVIILRKPGAAVYVNLVGSAAEMLLGKTANGGPNRDALSCELAAQRKQVALRPPDFALRNDLQDPHSL